MKIRRVSCGFTILELLIVIGIMAIMIALAVPALVGMAEGQGMKRAITTISGNLEMARAEAMAKSTWVWVGFSNATNNGISQMTILSIASRDGTSALNPDNIVSISKVQRIHNVALLGSPIVANAEPLGGNTLGYTFTAITAGQPMTFSNTVIAFSPQGEALIKTNDTVSAWVEVGVREMKGSTPITNKTASIRVSGVSGQVLVTY